MKLAFVLHVTSSAKEIKQSTKSEAGKETNSSTQQLGHSKKEQANEDKSLNEEIEKKESHEVKLR